MSEHDDLRVRLARQDPAPALDPVESPRAPELLERIMSTPVLTPTETDAGPRRRRLVALAAVAAAAAAVAIGVVALNGSSEPAKAPTTLALTLPSSNVMQSCLRFDVAILKDMSPAFAGTVTSVGNGKVVLDVDHWYAGAPADRVELAVPEPNSAATLDGVDFEVGKRYLVTAAQGNVNGCGYSGLATPDLEKAFTEAFG
ncbi:MAG: hypothetical protein ABR549_14215 [Mycobacteriales bacterium]